jgi:ribonuclease HI
LKTKEKYALFTDVSLNPQQKTGLGAYLIVPCALLDTPPDKIMKSDITDNIIVKRFEDTSSTKLEIETAIWALENFLPAAQTENASLTLFTDSQCVAGLLARRKKLEANGYKSKSSGKLLNHAGLYARFYDLHDIMGFEVVKVTGHSRSATHDSIHRIFSFLDREVRMKLKSKENDCNIIFELKEDK